MRRRGPYAWRPAYVSAVLETDSSKIFTRTVDALRMIDARLNEETGIPASERLAIESARQMLQMMEGQQIVDSLEGHPRAFDARRSQLVH
jgi:hypothetical protein